MRQTTLALSILLLAAPALAQSDRPAVTVSGDRLLVALPASVLKDRDVRTRLESALTTTFILKARLRGAKRESSARIEIRYDLWDEIFRVKRVEPDNKIVRGQLANAVQLDQWWRAPLELMRIGSDRDTVDLELVVLPFSAAEESDAREWLSKSGGAADPSSSSTGVVDVLIGTTLSARPVVSYHWSVEIVRR